MILALTSDTLRPGRRCTTSASIDPRSRSSSQVEGVGQVIVGGGALPAVRVEVNPTALNNYGLGLEDVRTALAAANANRPKGELADDERRLVDRRHRPALQGRRVRAADRRLPQRRAGAARRRRRRDRFGRGHRATPASPTASRRSCSSSSASRARTSSRPSTASARCCRSCRRRSRRRCKLDVVHGPHDDHPRLGARRADHADALDRPGHPGRLRVPARRARDAHPQRRRAGLADRHVRRDVPAAATASTTSR